MQNTDALDSRDIGETANTRDSQDTLGSEEIGDIAEPAVSLLAYHVICAYSVCSVLPVHALFSVSRADSVRTVLEECLGCLACLGSLHY